MFALFGCSLGYYVLSAMNGRSKGAMRILAEAHGCPTRVCRKLGERQRYCTVSYHIVVVCRRVKPQASLATKTTCSNGMMRR